MNMPAVASRASATSVFGYPLHANVMENWDRTLLELWEDKSMRAESLFYQRNIVYPTYGDISEYSQKDEAAAIHGDKALKKLWDDDWWDKAPNRLPRHHDESIRVLDPYEVVALSTSSPVPLAFDYTMSADQITVSGSTYAHFAPFVPYNVAPVSDVTLYDLGVWWYSVRRSKKPDELLTVGELAALFHPDIHRNSARILMLLPALLMDAVSEYRALLPEDEALTWAVLSTWAGTEEEPAVKKGEFYVPGREVYSLSRRVGIREAAEFVMAGIPLTRVPAFLDAGLNWGRSGQYILNGFTSIPAISRFFDNGIDADMAMVVST